MNRVSSYTDYKGNTVKYGYDELGNLISLTYAGGEIVRYKYYDNGALKEVIDTENLVTSYTYDKRGNLLTTQNPDGTTEVNTYDDLGQLATRTLYKAAAGEESRSNISDSPDNTSDYGEVIYSYTYTYDDWGNITGISYTDNLSDKDKTSDGLISDTKNETELLASSTMTYDSSNRMITYNGEKIEYDNDGNMTYGPLNGKMVSYEYDCRNRLIRAGDTEYTYDAENIRTATITPEYTEEYITDSVSALSRVLEIDRTYQGGYIQDNEDNAGKSTEHEIYYYGNGLVYEKTYADNEEEKTLIYHYDHLGSTKLVTDIDGETVCRFDYGTYGEPLTTEYDKTIRFLYNGQLGVVTDDNGLYYMRSRYYNPEIKRFINQDILTGSIGNSASLNRYSYVEGNPISYTDPFGLSPFSYFTDKIKPNISVHTALDALGCIPGPVGTFFDLTNAGLYFAEGDYGAAAESVIFAIPGMDLGGKGTKFIMKGTKAGKIVGNILKGVDFVGNVAAAFITADKFGNNVAGMIDKYMVNGESVSWSTAGEVGGLLVSGLMVGHYSKGAANSASSIDFSTKEFNPKDYAGKVVDESLIDNIAYKKVPSYDELQGGTYIISSSGKGGIEFAACFVAGTKIQTADGETNIEDIEIRDEVYACDVETGEIGLKKVKQTFVHDEKELVHVTIAGETIDTTSEHPFYVEGYGFKPAGELQSKDKVVLLDGTIAEVETIEVEHLEEPIKVYNFEVEDWHTYYVSGIGVLVHNDCRAKIIPSWKGSGPKSGVLGINDNSISNKAIMNYYPKEGGIEYVFDAETNTFVVGKVEGGYGSPHQKLADSIGADQSAKTTLGGTFSRDYLGKIITTENSGHFGKNWTPELRTQFKSVMKSYGLEVYHESWN